MADSTEGVKAWQWRRSRCKEEWSKYYLQARTTVCDSTHLASCNYARTFERDRQARPPSSDHAEGVGRGREGSAGGQGPQDPRASPILSVSSGLFYL